MPGPTKRADRYVDGGATVVGGEVVGGDVGRRRSTGDLVLGEVSLEASAMCELVLRVPLDPSDEPRAPAEARCDLVV